MKSILVDEEVYERLGKLAKPFVEKEPNQVLRRLLGLEGKTNKQLDIKPPAVVSRAYLKATGKDYNADPKKTAIEKLRLSSLHVHPAFLTFLLDKHYNSHGNFKVSNIIEFMERFNLKLDNGQLRNPWMDTSYKGEENGSVSCTRTIEHFRQTRRFSCWLGRNIKIDCGENLTCIYHPDNSDEIKNKCDLSKGVIWKRFKPNSPFSFGANYISVVEKELLKGKGILIKPLLSVFYPAEEFEEYTIKVFQKDFNFLPEEMTLFIV